MLADPFLSQLNLLGVFSRPSNIVGRQYSSCLYIHVIFDVRPRVALSLSLSLVVSAGYQCAQCCCVCTRWQLPLQTRPTWTCLIVWKGLPCWLHRDVWDVLHTVCVLPVCVAVMNAPHVVGVRVWWGCVSCAIAAHAKSYTHAGWLFFGGAWVVRWEMTPKWPRNVFLFYFRLLWI